LSPVSKVRESDGKLVVEPAEKDEVIVPGDAVLFRDDLNVYIGVALRAKAVNTEKGRVVWEMRVLFPASHLKQQLGDDGFRELLESQQPYRVGCHTIQPRATLNQFDLDREVFMSDALMDVSPQCIIRKVLVLEANEARSWYEKEGLPLPEDAKIATLKYDNLKGTLKLKRQRLTAGVAAEPPVSKKVRLMPWCEH